MCKLSAFDFRFVRVISPCTVTRPRSERTRLGVARISESLPENVRTRLLRFFVSPAPRSLYFRSFRARAGYFADFREIGTTFGSRSDRGRWKHSRNNGPAFGRRSRFVENPHVPVANRCHVFVERTQVALPAPVARNSDDTQRENTTKGLPPKKKHNTRLTRRDSPYSVNAADRTVAGNKKKSLRSRVRVSYASRGVRDSEFTGNAETRAIFLVPVLFFCSSRFTRYGLTNRLARVSVASRENTDYVSNRRFRILNEPGGGLSATYSGTHAHRARAYHNRNPRNHRQFEIGRCMVR